MRNIDMWILPTSMRIIVMWILWCEYCLQVGEILSMCILYQKAREILLLCEYFLYIYIWNVINLNDGYLLKNQID